MTDLPDAVVGDAHTSDFGWSVLTDLVDGDRRMAGHEGEVAAARLIAEAFEEAGAREVEIDEFPIPGWWRGSSALTAGGRTYDQSHEVLALPGTPAGRVSAELVDVREGSLAQVEDADPAGAIAIASSRAPRDSDRWLHRMEKYTAAAEAGAVGFVFSHHSDGCLPQTGEVGYHNRPGPIPAVGVSKELGDRLRRRLDDSSMTAELEVTCETGPAQSQNVEAAVGPETDREVLVTAHVDAHDITEGAVDNAVGCAVIAEVARLLGAVRDALDTRVRLVAFGAEEIGLYGAYHWAATHDLDRVKCAVNVDGAGTSRTPRISTNGFEDLTGAIEDVSDRTGSPLQTDDGVSPHGDQWALVERGVPAVMLSTVSDQSGRGWGHTYADTLDKVDPRDVRSLAASVAAIVFELASEHRTFARASEEEIRNALSSAYEQELKAGGRWHFDT